MRLSVSLALVSVFASFNLMGQYSNNGFCCDPSSTDPDLQVAFTCASQSEQYESPVDGNVCDPDCSDYTDGSGCTTIPLDGGLSLLALAGGGLATAAMRRRREEEEAAQGAA